MKTRDLKQKHKRNQTIRIEWQVYPVAREPGKTKGK